MQSMKTRERSEIFIRDFLLTSTMNDIEHLRHPEFLEAYSNRNVYSMQTMLQAFIEASMVLHNSTDEEVRNLSEKCWDDLLGFGSITKEDFENNNYCIEAGKPRRTSIELIV